MKVAVLTPRPLDPAAAGAAERWPLTLAAGLAEARPGRISVELVTSGTDAWRRALGPQLTLVSLAAAATGAPTWELIGVIRGCDAVVVDAALSPFGQAALLATAHARRPCVAALGGGDDPDPRDGLGGAVALAGAVLHQDDAERQGWLDADRRVLGDRVATLLEALRERRR